MNFKIINSIRSSIAVLIVSVSISASMAFAVVPDEVQAVFANNTCLNCHTGGNPSGGLSLDDATISDASLVNIVANCSNNNTHLVEPGDPENSVLYIKLASANPNCGGVMPPSGQLISAVDLATIYDWIISIGPAANFGLFSMDQIAITVQETDDTVTLLVSRELGTTGEVTVDFSVATVGIDTATDPDDYIAQTGTLVFADGETSKEIVVDLVDDEVFEGTEIFSVTLSNPMGGAVLGGAIQTKISITDNEFDNKPGTFFFGRVAYSVNEMDGNLEVLVIRSFGASGEVTVNFATGDSSALNGSDYQLVNTTLTFAEGEKNQTVMIAIIDDEIEEGSETFTLSLSNPGGGAILGAPSNVTATIDDDDAPEDETPPDDDTPPDDGTGGGDDTGDDVIILPIEDEVDYEPAGSLSFGFSLLLAVLIRRRYIFLNKK